MKWIVDTGVWIRLLRKETAVRGKLETAFANRDDVIVTPIAYYELLRGLQKRRDDLSAQFILTLWKSCSYVETTRAVWDEAIRLWVLAVRKNEKREDADVLIAAIASVVGGVVVTDNMKHFVTFETPVVDWTGGGPK